MNIFVFYYSDQDKSEKTGPKVKKDSFNDTFRFNSPMRNEKVRRTLLCIRDGWGLNGNEAVAKWDATRQIATPTTQYLEKAWPRTEIQASGNFVGLPDGIMGNSEVGHQNIGAGRIVDQEIVRINKAIRLGTIGENPVFVEAVRWAKKQGSKVHLMGLLSSGGVHSLIEHAEGLVTSLRAAGLEKIYMHAFLDGRDTPPQSGLDYVKNWQQFADQIGTGKIASIGGRFWAMDRDQRWDRVEKAYRCLTGQGGDRSQSPEEALQKYYDQPRSELQKGDEFVTPTAIVDENGNLEGVIEDNDVVIFFNFRGDRPREITKAFTDADFNAFKREKLLKLFYVTMTEYEAGLCPHVLFPKPLPMKNILGAYLDQLGLRQFRTAETEKYAHVTFFFNDYREQPFTHEARQLINSPKDVATYDQKPEMSADAVCQALLKAIADPQYDFLLVNFANPDMVGHTGNFEAAKKAIATVDRCLGDLIRAAERHQVQLVITADHGNAEQMWDPTHQVPHTQHTTNPVELMIYGSGLDRLKLREGGCLADIAPTVLELMGLAQPEEMTGKSLIVT